MIYVIKGSGKIYAGNEIFNVNTGDVIDVPVFYPEQSKIITEK